MADQATRPRTAADWQATVDDLAVQLGASREEANEIEASRGPVALKAQLGDADARRLLDAQDAELERITRQRRTLEQARVEAKREMEAAEQREAERRQAKDEREAAKLTAEARQVAERLDEGIVQCASDALELERLLVQASRLRGGGPNVHARIERAVRGAYWHRGLKVGDFTRPDMRGPLIEGLGAQLGVAKKERAA